MSGKEASDRLSSWKEIAAYLDHDVRTVQRWEKEDGLPVHRHPYRRRGTVFAHSAELDDWLCQRPVGARPKPRWLPTLQYWGVFRLAVVSISVTALLVLLLFFFKKYPGEGEGPSQSRIAELMFADAAVSPAGNRIAYRDAERGHLWMLDVESGERQLVTAERTFSAPAWSLDGKRIAFATFKSRQGRLTLFDVSRAQRRQIGIRGMDDAPLRPQNWAGDRRLLCMIGRQLVVVDVESGRARSIGKLPPGARDARISPDGSLIAYTSFREENPDLSIAPTHQVDQPFWSTISSDWEYQPIWHPDGKKLLFFRYQGSDRDQSLWSVELDSDRELWSQVVERRLMGLDYARREMRPALSSEGILFFSRRLSFSEVKILERSGEGGQYGEAYLTEFPEASAPHHWSGADKLCYVRHVDIGEGLPMVERDLESGRELLVDRTAHLPSLDRFPKEEFPRRSYRSGQPFEYLGNQSHVYRKRVSGDTLELLYEMKDSRIEGLNISREGHSLAISTYSEEKESFGLFFLNLTDGSSSLPVESRTKPFVSWSHDDKRAAYTDANCLMVVSIETGQVSAATCASSAPYLAARDAFAGPYYQMLWDTSLGVNWSPDDRYVAWTVPIPERQLVELQLVEIESGRYRVAWSGEDGYRSMPRDVIWSPTGRWIAFALYHVPDFEIWAAGGWE